MNIKHVASLLAVLFVSTTSSAAVDELEQRATWSVPTIERVRVQVNAWIESKQLDDATVAEVERVWNEPDAAVGVDALERLAASFAIADPQTRELVDLCRDVPPLAPPPFAFLQDEDVAPFVRRNLRLYYGRWLAQHALYDEAESQLGGLAAEDVVDPASLLFYQSVVYHRLLKKDECLAAATRLLENEATLPRRYRSVAQLIERDIRPLEADSLDEVSRLMEDIERRLRLGRAGTRVRKEEDDVIAKLDKMIKKLEQQQQQQQQSKGANGQLQPSKPADDSIAAGGTGPGDVDQKKLDHKVDWGNLPPKARQQALQQISKDLPTHFRDVVEEYFRRLAQDD